MSVPLTVYIPTCDANSFVLKYFQYFFNKYWSSDINVKILGFNKPSFDFDKNIEFISLGNEQVGGAKGWSNYLIDYFSDLKDDHFIFGIDDFVIARPVDEQALSACFKMIDEKTGRIDLQCSMQYARHPRNTHFHGSVDGINFLALNQNSNGECLYQNSGAFSVWNRKWFLKNIERDWSPWDWETQGSMKAQGDGYNVIGSVDRWAIKKFELVSDRAWPGVLNTRGIRKNDVEQMKKISSSFDRINKFEDVMDERWGYYDVCGPNWMQIIFGD